ncbi:hypothetical protein C8Q78DRAFT_654831 [Trametes maxima]|nr:hypothetical protein C8Q78DRAFT_654831 [Trametes maxima]
MLITIGRGLAGAPCRLIEPRKHPARRPACGPATDAPHCKRNSDAMSRRVCLCACACVSFGGVDCSRGQFVRPSRGRGLPARRCDAILAFSAQLGSATRVPGHAGGGPCGAARCSARRLRLSLRECSLQRPAVAYRGVSAGGARSLWPEQRGGRGRPRAPAICIYPLSRPPPDGVRRCYMSRCCVCTLNTANPPPAPNPAQASRTCMCPAHPRCSGEAASWG